MKRIILAVVVTACFASQINAQFHFGLKGGLNFANFKIEQSIKQAKDQVTIENSTGWQAGALLQIKIPVIGLAFQPELLYTVRKVDMDQKAHGIHYFEVPVNLQFGLDLKVLRPYLQAGPYFGYALKTDGEHFENISKLDWGAGIGGGLEIWKFQLDARYSWGLQDVSSVKEFEIKNNRFTVSLGILF